MRLQTVLLVNRHTLQAENKYCTNAVVMSNIKRNGLLYVIEYSVLKSKMTQSQKQRANQHLYVSANNNTKNTTTFNLVVGRLVVMKLVTSFFTSKNALI